jgi:hypothetical protein
MDSMMKLEDYRREDGWLLVSVYAFGWILHNRNTGETVRVPRKYSVEIVEL